MPSLKLEQTNRNMEKNIFTVRLFTTVNCGAFVIIAKAASSDGEKDTLAVPTLLIIHIV